MEEVVLTIHATDAYWARLDWVKRDEDRRKCICWFDRKTMAADAVQVTLDDTGIVLAYTGSRGAVKARAAYDDILEVTEVRSGILLRLTHRRLLFLPAGEDDEALIDADVMLGERCKYTFRSARMRLRGVPVGRMLEFHTRPGRWHNNGRLFVKRFLLTSICMALMAGTLLVCIPFFWNQEIDREEAVPLSATFEDYKAEYRLRRGHQRLEGFKLQFVELGVRDVDDNCPIGILEDNLKLAQPGDTMRLLTHPESGDLLSIETENTVILSFEDYTKYLRRHNAFYILFGLFFYAGAGVLIRELKGPKKRKRKS